MGDLEPAWSPEGAHDLDHVAQVGVRVFQQWYGWHIVHEAYVVVGRRNAIVLYIFAIDAGVSGDVVEEKTRRAVLVQRYPLTLEFVHVGSGDRVAGTTADCILVKDNLLVAWASGAKDSEVGCRRVSLALRCRGNGVVSCIRDVRNVAFAEYDFHRLLIHGVQLLFLRDPSVSK